MQSAETGTCRDAEREQGRERYLKDSFSPATCSAPPSHGKCDSKEAGIWYLGTGVCVWVTACEGQQGRVEAGSRVRLGCRFRVLLSPCLCLSGSFHFSKDGQAGLRKMSPSRLRGYSQVFSAQWFKQLAFFVCLLCARTQLQDSPFPSMSCPGMDRHPMGNSVQQGHLEAHILSTMRKQDPLSRACTLKCLCLLPTSSNPVREDLLL